MEKDEEKEVQPQFETGTQVCSTNLKAHLWIKRVVLEFIKLKANGI